MSGEVIDPQFMDLSSTDVSDSDTAATPRSSTHSVYVPQVAVGSELNPRIRLVSRCRRFGRQEAQESLKRKKERYDKKKHALEVLVLFHLLLFRKALELTAREKRLEERERTMQASEGYGGSEKPAENAGPSLAEENARLHQEVSDLRLQLELCVRSVDRDATGEKDRLRRRALELTQREQSLLQREEETDRWHEEAAELRRDAEAKAQEAERLLYSKRKELDELESSRQEVASREAALASMQQLKEEAVDQRREQVRLL